MSKKLDQELQESLNEYINKFVNILGKHLKTDGKEQDNGSEPFSFDWINKSTDTTKLDEAVDRIFKQLNKMGIKFADGEEVEEDPAEQNSIYGTDNQELRADVYTHPVSTVEEYMSKYKYSSIIRQPKSNTYFKISITDSNDISKAKYFKTDSVTDLSTALDHINYLIRRHLSSNDIDALRIEYYDSDKYEPKFILSLCDNEQDDKIKMLNTFIQECDDSKEPIVRSLGIIVSIAKADYETLHKFEPSVEESVTPLWNVDNDKSLLENIESIIEDYRDRAECRFKYAAIANCRVSRTICKYALKNKISPREVAIYGFYKKKIGASMEAYKLYNRVANELQQLLLLTNSSSTRKDKIEVLEELLQELKQED